MSCHHSFRNDDCLSCWKRDFARLQERVEEAEREIKRLKVLRGGASRDLEEAKKRLNNLHSNHTVHHEEHHVQVGELEDERDEARALAERRKAKLETFGLVLPNEDVWHLHTCEAGFIDGVRETCEDDCAEIAALIKEEK